MEQFSGNGKGFSFQVDEPLIMTFGDPKDYIFTAATIVNEWEEENIKNILKGYGEERFSGRIANAIVKAREVKSIETTFELVEIIKEIVPAFYRNGRLHPATRTFQALRIAVNDEFRALEDFIKESMLLLNPGGRLAIITFHSLEDRIVKHHFRNYTHDHGGVVLTKKPITATLEELQSNPRARSAKLRIFEKL
jgi:16S rRNA (cytosine1402-N4)-methyltransferase